MITYIIVVITKHPHIHVSTHKRRIDDDAQLFTQSKLKNIAFC